MQRTHAVAKRMTVRHRGRDIRFGQKNCLGQSTPMRQIACQCGGEGTSRAMGGIRTLTLGLEDFLFGAPGRNEAEKVCRLLQMASGHYNIRRSQRMQAGSRLAHLLEVRDCHPGQNAGLIKVRRDDLSQREQPSRSIAVYPPHPINPLPELDFKIGSSTT